MFARISMPWTMLLALGNWMMIAPDLTFCSPVPALIVCAVVVACAAVVMTTAVFCPAVVVLLVVSAPSGLGRTKVTGAAAVGATTLAEPGPVLKL